ncbi:hypothetical protein OQA88_2477 [Cercophora sp. LCS_1]
MGSPSSKNNKDRVLSILNNPPKRLTGPELLHELLQRSPAEEEAPAIDFLSVTGSRSSLSYPDFHRCADALAARIVQHVGTQAEAESFVIPVLIPQGLDLYIAMVAILKAGAAFCPLNLDIPPERAKLILDDVSSKIVLTTRELSSKIPDDVSRVVLVVDGAHDASCRSTPSANPDYRKPRPTDLAYVMYTSGSTGTPKGVGVSHEAAVQSLLAHVRHIPSFSRFLQFAAPTFDVSVFEIFFPLMMGKTLVSCSRSAMLDDLPAVLTKMNVDACELTPSVAGSLLRKRSNAPGLRVLLTIGEMLTRPVVDEFGGGYDQASMLWAMYGPTEAAIHCTVHPGLRTDAPVSDIGVPFDTVSAFILPALESDEPQHAADFRVLPRGEIGELVVGGYQVAREYINRPEQTAKAFIDTPYGRLYRTGDKAKINPDGTLECLGRIGFGQVKLRGQRVELGEIEHAALKTPGCHGAFAVIISNILVLFCAVDEIDGIQAAVLESCKAWLPSFMIPGDIVAAKDFPRLASGKVDRKLLAATYATKQKDNPVPEEPAMDEVDRQLCAIVGQVLGKKVQPSVNLSRYGLDSLVAIRVASALRGAGFELGATDILRSPIISSLRPRLKQQETEPRLQLAADGMDQGLSWPSDALTDAAILTNGRDIEAVLPCTPLQMSMLAETVRNPQAYCNWVELTIPPVYVATDVRSWFSQLSQANEAFRTGFVHHQGEFLQVIFSSPSEADISIVTEPPAKEFHMLEMQDLARPFRVQIASQPAGDNGRPVLVQLHHAVYDGWSMDLMLSDLERLMEGKPLRPRPHFRQVSQFTQAPRFLEDCDAARGFWAEQFVGFQPMSLPNLLPVHQDQDVSSTSVSMSLDIAPKTVEEGLRPSGCGAQTLFQAALSWLLGSLLGTEDVLLGTISSGRTLPITGIEDIMGPCIASIPIRTNLSQVRTIKELVTSIHASNRTALPYGILPLADIKRLAGVHPGQSLYDVLFVYQDSLPSRERLARIIQPVAQHDYLETKVLFEVEPTSDSFKCRLTFHSDALLKAQTAALGRCLTSLVSFMVGHLESDLSRLQTAFDQSLLSIDNDGLRRSQDLLAVSGHAVARDDTNLASAVERVARQDSDLEALCFADYMEDGRLQATTLTFGGLNKLANQIAHLLLSKGVQPGQPVAIVMEKSVLLYAGILAVLKAGCAYVPHLPTTPLARVATIFQQAGVKICLTDTAAKATFSGLPECDFVDLQTALLSGFSSNDPATPGDLDRMAYIMFTSGSTGIPKGVCLTQRNIVSHLHHLAALYPVGENPRLLQSCSQAFDVSVFEIFFSWTRGMCLCSATNDTLFEDLERSIRLLRVTHLSMTPTVASLVDPENTPGVRFLVTAGEAMTDIVAKKWLGKLYQGYGPSETTNICTVRKMESNSNIRHLGYCFDNTSTVVLFRDSLNPVPRACLGELCFGGDQVAQGYLAQPDLTASKFITHPIYGRLYRSGDLGRMLPDGSLLIVGRVDDQIKIRGQRVELDEITSTIKQSLPSVVDCATILVKNSVGSSTERIVSFIVLRSGQAAHFTNLAGSDEIEHTVQDLFQQLLSRLPGYMIPSFIIPISVLPTTASGKLDRARLVKEVESLGNDSLARLTAVTYSDGNAEPLSDVERKIADAVFAVFGTELQEIQRWTPLVTLGLDSISAIQLSKEVQKTTGRRLAISTMLQNPTVAKLALVLSEHSETTASHETELVPSVLKDTVGQRAALSGRVVADVLPCTPLQEAMLATSVDRGSYWNRMLFKVKDRNVTGQLQDSFSAASRRHGILRTCFVSNSSGQFSQISLLQVVFKEWKHTWHRFEVSKVEDGLMAHLEAMAPAIDSWEPPVSLATIRVEDEIHISFICHHALYDGVAIQHLLAEVEQLARGISLPPPPSYRAFLREALMMPPSDDKFWSEHLSGYKPKLLAGVKSPSSRVSTTVLQMELALSLSFVTGRTKELGVSLLSLTQAAWAVTVRCLFRDEDVCFGNVMSGRSLSLERLEELVAPCFNTIPVRMNILDKRRNFDLMKAFQHANPDFIAHQFTALRRIQALLSHNGSRRLFDTLLLLQQPVRKLDSEIWDLERDDGDMDIPVVCEVIPDNERDWIGVKLHVNSHAISQQAAEVVIKLFLQAFESCVKFPASSPDISTSLPEDWKSAIDSVSIETALSSHPKAATTTNGHLWSPTGQAIRDVLSTLSSRDSERINPSTTIYQLGLDSINAVQVASLLRKQGFTVSASDVIANPTCQALAAILDQHSVMTGILEPSFDVQGFGSDIQSQIDGLGISPEKIEVVLPCTPAQEGMISQFVKSGGKDYFNFINVRVSREFDSSQIARAGDKLTTLHPILRTGFTAVEHDTSSFAMIQYRQGVIAKPFWVVPHEQHDKEVAQWRAEAFRSAMEKLHERPWGAAIQQTEGGCIVHFALHHALYDALSLQVILRDFGDILSGGPICQPPPLQAVVGEILGTTSRAVNTSNEFWKSQAQNVVINAFPIMTPLRDTSREILIQSHLGSLKFSELEKAVSVSGYTMQATLQAAWTRILSAYLGEQSVTYGVVLSGRTTDVTQRAVFPCITTLPVISRNVESNRGLMDQTMAYNSELHRQQHQSLTRIQRWLGRSDSRLFDTLLVYQRFDLDSQDTPSLAIVDDQATVDYPVSVEVEPQNNGLLKYQVTFFSDILPTSQAVLLLKQFDAIVCHLALHPDENDFDLSKHSPELFSMLPPERPQLPAPVRFLHEFVEVQAASIPDKVALTFVNRLDDKLLGRQRSWTYQELNFNGNRIANALLPHVKVGDIVAVNFNKCPEAYFGILGVLKSGCSFVALDPEAPAARKEFIIRDSGASALLTTSQGLTDLGFAPPVPTLVVDQKMLEAQPSEAAVLSRQLEPSDVCYCLYTSGTTGTPKGCEITHENAVQCMLAFQEIFEGHWDETSRWLQFASLHFDVSVLEQYWSWSVGITVVAAPKDLILSDLAGTISNLDITHIDLTPSLARLVHPDDVPSLCRGVFITGGESLKQEILDVWGDKAVIYNFYGPTEATIGVTVYPRVPRNGRASNIGRQFINVGSYVLKPGTQKPVLRGAVGELCVSGKLVGKGYLKRDDLTAERFPTLKHFGERVYRTGDLVRVLHDNCFDFLGRADDQVKLRGQRLEIGEINQAIKSGVDSISDVATLVVRNEKQQKDLLVSFVVVVGDNNRRTRGALEVVRLPEASELCRLARNACRSKLPGYMVPTYVFQLPFIPLSSNNKAEVKELRSLFNSLSQDEIVSLSSSAEGSPTQLSETCKQVISVIANMQGVDPSIISGSSSIFELGIDSISVLRLSRALKREGLSQASPAIILQNPLVGDLAHVLENSKSSTVGPAVMAARQLIEACSHRYKSHVCGELGVTSDQIEYIAPCSPLQQGMISRATRDGVYFNTFTFELSQDTSTDRLRVAWKKAAEQFPILRTQFVRTVDGYIQVALRDIALPWGEELLAKSKEQATLDDGKNTWVSKNVENFTRPWQVVVLGGGNGVRNLVLHIFHGLYDANSFSLMMDGIGAYYNDPGLVNGATETVYGVDTANGLALGFTANSARVGLAPSFLDALCHGPLQNFGSCKQFWISHFEGVPAMSSHSLNDVDLTPSKFEREVTLSGLENLRSRLGVTHQAIVQAAWVYALAKLHADNPTIGIITSGRTLEMDRADEVVGPLFNTLPFHARVYGQGAGDWASLVRQCHDFNVVVASFQHVPLRDVQKWCARGKPLFDTLFSFQLTNAFTTENSLWTEVPAESSADYPLALEATLAAEGKLRLLLVSQGGPSYAKNLQSLMDDLEIALFSMLPDGGSLCLASQMGQTGAVVKPIVNGHGPNGYSDQGNGVPFHWTDDALTIRLEMATLADVSADVVTETTSILELGLDSIDSIQLSARLKRHGIVVTVGQLLKAQTISNIVRALEAPQTNGDLVNGHPQIQSTAKALEDHLFTHQGLQDVEAVLPTTPLQDSMVREMIHSDFQLYFNHDVLEVPADVNLERLMSAWRSVITASPILRTSFLAVDDGQFDFAYCQVVHKKWAGEILQTDLDSMDDMNKVIDRAVQRARKEDGQSNLLQLALVTVAETRFVVLSIAHALYDGWSLGLIHQDVQAAYRQGAAPSRPSYDDYLEKALFRSEDASTFWSSYLEEASSTLYPEKSSGDRIFHRASKPSSTSVTDVTAFRKQQAITLQTLGEACWAAVLASKIGSLDVTFGVVLSGRDSETAERLVFPTMNTVAVRSILHGNVKSWLRYMQENTNGVTEFQHFPLRKAQKFVRGKGMLFNTLFIQQRVMGGGDSAGGEVMRSMRGESSVEYPVCVEMEVRNEKLIWTVGCDDGYVAREEVDELLAALDEVLARILADPEGDVLRFEQGKTAVCGLAISRASKAAHQPESTNGADDVAPQAKEDDEWGSEWSPVQESIRQALSQVSGVPIQSISKTHTIYHMGLDSISAIRVISVLRAKGVVVAFRDVLKARSIVEMAMLASVRQSHQVESQAMHDGQVSDSFPVSDQATNGRVPGASRRPLHQGSGSSTAWDQAPDHNSDIQGPSLSTLTTKPNGILGTLTEQPSTLSHLSLLPSSERDSVTTQLGAMDMSEIEETLLATAMQVHMLSVWKLTDGETFYHRFKYRLASISISAVFAAWDKLVAEMPLLRTTFVATEMPLVPILQLIKRRGSFDSSYASLQVNPVGEDCHVQLRIHHALYDAVSLAIILRRFRDLCNGKIEKLPHTMPAWSSFASAPLEATNRKAREKFWTEYLDGVKPATTWPAQSDDTYPVSPGRIAHVSDAISGMAHIKSIGAQQGLSMQTLFFAAYAHWLLTKFPTPSNEVVFGVYLANRAETDPHGQLPYPTLCLVPLRVKAAETIVDTARAIKCGLLEISDPINAAVGLWEVKEWTGLVVNSFVNFLTSESFSASEGGPTEAGIKLEKIDGLASGDYEFGFDGCAKPDELGRVVVEGAYVDSVDIEVKIDGDQMVIGVFGPGEKLSMGAETVIRGIIGALGGLEQAGMKGKY